MDCYDNILKITCDTGKNTKDDSLLNFYLITYPTYANQMEVDVEICFFSSPSLSDNVELIYLLLQVEWSKGVNRINVFGKTVQHELSPASYTIYFWPILSKGKKQ